MKARFEADRVRKIVSNRSVLPDGRLATLWIIGFCFSLAAAANGQLDAAYYENTVSGLFWNSIPGERVPVDPSSSGFQQFAEGSQTLTSPFMARVYFGTEGASYGSRLGFTTDGTGLQTGTGGIIFEDTSIPPLHQGDFVNLGTFASGTPLDFFLIIDANNYLGGGTRGLASTQPAANSDSVMDHTVQLLQHVGPNGNIYLVYGFEDEPGLGDRDFNDVVFTLEVSPIPEPSSTILLAVGLGGLALGVVGRRRSRRFLVRGDR